MLSKNHYIVKNVKKKFQKKNFFSTIGPWLLLDLCRKMIYKVENFLFWFFQNMFFGQNLTVEKWGGEVRFFHFDVPWGGRSFFLIFFKKSCHYVLCGKSTFFENRISNGMEDHFFCFFFKKSCHHILWGKNTFFGQWDFQWGERTFFV